VACRMVVGADGRQSSVRRALGVEMAHQESAYTLGGLLVRGDGWPAHAANGTEGSAYFLIFPRPDHLARLYLAVEPGPHTGGADRTAHFLDTFRLDCLPYGEALAEAEPAGPCAYVRGSDSWTDDPVVEGVVLIGDAAGWTDPIIGEGLSVAMRDARMVSEVLLGEDWSPSAFTPYVEERAERCRRLRIGAHLMTETRCTFTPEGRARRDAFGAEMMTNPLSLGLMFSLFAGPETAPAEAFAPENVNRILALT
jgi:2-polyprenyl-6-methoxyphenol hydroxylase-like FAD-dependent oxidoreductase